MHREARAWIDRLELVPHPEGGWFRETYRAAGSTEGRCFCTAIYYLLTSDQVSTLHRLRSDEMFHHYAGDTLTIHRIVEDGEYRRTPVGPDGEGDARFTLLVPAGEWFGATVDAAEGWSLVGCTVAPGFEFVDFEIADRDALVARYPDHRELITRLTR